MQASSSWNLNAKPFVEGFFEIPKALGRTAIKDGDAIPNDRDNDTRDIEHHHTVWLDQADDESGRITQGRFPSQHSMSL